MKNGCLRRRLANSLGTCSYFMVLTSTVPYHTVHHCTSPYYTGLHCTSLYFIVLQRSSPHFTVFTREIRTICTVLPYLVEFDRNSSYRWPRLADRTSPYFIVLCPSWPNLIVLGRTSSHLTVLHCSWLYERREVVAWWLRHWTSVPLDRVRFPDRAITLYP